MAIACGFLIVILLCLICFFAHKTRSKIWKYGKQNIYWDKVPVVQEGPNVEEWVSLDAGWGRVFPATFCQVCAAPVPGPGVFAHRTSRARCYRCQRNAVPSARRVPPCHPIIDAVAFPSWYHSPAPRGFAQGARLGELVLNSLKDKQGGM